MTSICCICGRTTGSPHKLEINVFEKHDICPDCLVYSEHEYAKMARTREALKNRKKKK